MRLIDADELVTTILTNDLCGDDNVDKAILNAPTVKAITVEWIEEWGWKNGMSESMSLRVMIDDWEKENEERTNA